MLPTINDQNPQVIVLDNSSSWRNDFGYGDRPLRFKSQIRDRYLDTCAVWAYKSITGVAVWADPFTISLPFSATAVNLPLTITGKLNRTIDSNGYIVIPKDWTYIISWFTQFLNNSNTTVAWIFTRISYKLADLVTTWVLYHTSNYRLLSNDTVGFTYTTNLNRWDRFLMYSWHAVTWVAIDVYEYFFLTLLS